MEKLSPRGEPEKKSSARVESPSPEKGEPEKGEPEKKSSKQEKERRLREKAKNTLERLSRKAIKDAAEIKDTKGDKEDMTRSQKDIQKLENLLDAAQVKAFMPIVIPAMYLLISDPRETFWSEVTCALMEPLPDVPDPFLSSPPSHYQELKSFSQDPWLCQESLRGNDTLLTMTYPLSLSLLLFPLLIFRAQADNIYFQAVYRALYCLYLFNSNFIFKSVSVSEINVYKENCGHIPELCINTTVI